MSRLVRRALNAYRDEGVYVTLDKSVRLFPRYFLHVLGTTGLYGRPRYRRFLIWWNSRPFFAIANPFKIIHINPSEVTRITRRGPNPGRFQWQDLGTIRGGNWDQNTEQFEDLPVVNALRQRYCDGFDWKEIDFIQRVIRHAKRGNVIWKGCKSEKDVFRACSQIDQLYENIQVNGYMSREELIEQGKMSPDKYVAGDRFNRYDEVTVDIDRDGEFLFVDGRHRLAIAKLLDIEGIPVRISARHSGWQRIRETVDRAESTDDLPEPIHDLLDHPDLQDVRTG